MTGYERVNNMTEVPNVREWEHLPTEERYEFNRRLHQVTVTIARIIGLSVEEVIVQALGGNVRLGDDYVRGFRRGRISVARARSIHEWITQHHFRQAHGADPELFAEDPEILWEEFVDARLSPRGFQIVPWKADMGIVQLSKDKTSCVPTLRLEQDFVFELTSPHAGWAVAYQHYAGTWHPVPLGPDQRRLRSAIKEGVQRLPKGGSGEVFPLFEGNDTGRHSFVLITATDKDLLCDRFGFHNLKDDERVTTYRTEVRFVP